MMSAKVETGDCMRDLKLIWISIESSTSLCLHATIQVVQTAQIFKIKALSVCYLTDQPCNESEHVSLTLGYLTQKKNES